eukprot:XP_001707457.1 Hypothetical protein GL50803_4439 [Giardia lamblia ATCC 50803]
MSKGGRTAEDRPGATAGDRQLFTVTLRLQRRGLGAPACRHAPPAQRESPGPGAAPRIGDAAVLLGALQQGYVLLEGHGRRNGPGPYHDRRGIP